MLAADLRRLVVVPPAGCTVDWQDVCQIVAPHVPGLAVPDAAYPVRVRARRLRSLKGPQEQDLLAAVRCPDGRLLAAGGRLQYLDLPGLATAAWQQARARWWVWKTQVARGTPTARPWESFLTAHERAPGKQSPAQVRRRFAAQPRVLAMVAASGLPGSGVVLDPDELEAYQAGELVYITLAWQRAVAGDAVIDPRGRLHRPASPSVADRLVHLRAAVGWLQALTPDRFLAAASLAPA